MTRRCTAGCCVDSRSGSADSAAALSEDGHDAPRRAQHERLKMATMQRFQISRTWLVLARLGLALTLAAGGVTACKKSGDAVEAVPGKKPPIVKAKKPAAGAKADEAKAKDGPAATDAAAKPTAPGVDPLRAPASRPVAAAEAPTPVAVPAPAVAAPAVAVAAAPAAAAPAPVVPTPIGRGKPGEVVAKAEPPKPEPAKPDAAAKAEEAPLPPGAVVVRAMPGEAPLDVNGYIIAADLPKVLGPKQKFHRTDLVGINPTPNYNAMFYATDKADLFGVSVQVWRDPNLAESRTRFNTMKNSYSNVTPTNKITDMGFRSFFGNVVTLVFVDPRRPLLAAVSCSTKVCNGDQMIELARRVAERLH